MDLHAPGFFAELGLPFTDSTVVGNTYYASPDPGGPLRLRIDFSRTIRAEEFGGLRIAVIHQDRGELDATVLGFDEHGTFRRRDEASGLRPGLLGYAVFTKYHARGQSPWHGAETATLRDAIRQYASVWFPGAWTTTAPTRAAVPAPRKAPDPPIARNGRRAR